MPRTDPESRRDYELFRRYGVPEGTYKALLEAQGGGCAICGKKPRTRSLALDHCHGCGRARGLLCSGMTGCNKSLGPFEHDPEVARRAAAYLLEIASDLSGHKLTKMSRSRKDTK